MNGTPLDDPGRGPELKAIIARKAALRDWYAGIYARWASALREVPSGGVVAEVGSGAGFAREVIPGLLATDVTPYAGLDAIIDAGSLPWDTGSVRALFMLNVLHHLPDAPAFLAEAQRVIKPGGLLLITDQHLGHFSRWLLRLAHHEPFDPRASDWLVPARHALSGANGALAWIIFWRDRPQFERRFPALRLTAYEPFSPLGYWLSGGLKRWSLLPGSSLKALKAFESRLLRLSPAFGSFVHIEIRRREPTSQDHLRHHECKNIVAPLGSEGGVHRYLRATDDVPPIDSPRPFPENRCHARWVAGLTLNS